MGAKRAAIAVTIGLCLGWLFKNPKNLSKSKGNVVEPQYHEIRQLFDEMLEDEREGLAMAIYKNNELVVDLWGGFAEKDAMREWKMDTMTVAFSSTKAIGALIVAILVSRGHMKYEDLVTKHWPEFGANGKQDTTVQWIVEHKAGLITFDGDLSIEQAKDHRYISRLIEKTVPSWPPGTAVGYHAITYGWLIDQLVRRVDPEKRGVGDFYRQEIQVHMKKKDEFFLGLPLDQHSRMARIMQPTLTNWIKSFISTPNYLMFFGNYLRNRECSMCNSARYPLWMSVLSIEMPYNNPEVREIENVAALGIGTARGMANVVVTILQRNMISAEVWDQLKHPVEMVHDHLTSMKSYRGHGFFYEQIPERANSFVLWHGGHGMQSLIIDPDKQVVMAVLRNALSMNLIECQRSLSIAMKIVNA